MNTQSNPLKIISFLNFFLVSLLAIDTLSPSEDIASEKYDSIIIDEYKYSGYNQGRISHGGYETRNLLICEENHTYRIGNTPESLLNLKQGDNIKVAKTLYFSVAYRVGVKEKSSFEWHNVSLLSNVYIIILLIITVAISITHLFYYTSLMDILLALSSVTIYCISGVYFFYF